MKTQTQKTETPTTDAQVIPLQQFYLSMLCTVINADRLDVLQQEIDPQAGRLYMVSTGTSAPRFILTYKFEADTVTLAIEGRDNRTLPPHTVRYAEGLDAYLIELQKFLRANRLAAPKAA